MQNKNEGNGNKIILGDLNCNMGRLERDGEKKNTKTLYVLFQLWSVKTHGG